MLTGDFDLIVVVFSTRRRNINTDDQLSPPVPPVHELCHYVHILKRLRTHFVYPQQ